MKIEEAVERALKNIAKHGDTDIFPFPFETHVFLDRPKECKSILLDIHQNFSHYLAQQTPSNLETLTQVGYTGFRWATQIEPFWNAYFLALVISIADQVESVRPPLEDNSVFSYRYQWDNDNAKLFRDSAWADYRARGMALSEEFKYVVVTDIADFYPRIYHHRLENALQRLPKVGETPNRIMQLLGTFSDNVSYGLPVGGPASRMLAELALVATDMQLSRRGIKFCRYVDDYCIFCDNKSEAYKVLVTLSEKLHNEGLVLQKKKTKIITTEEYREANNLLDPADNTNPVASEEQKLLNISLRYDPYSDTADEDYETLKAAVKDVDILGILGREVLKTTIDATVSKQAIKAIYALNNDAKFGAITTLLDKDNLVVLSPVFVTVMRAVNGLYDDIPDMGKNFIDETLIELYESKSHLLSVELNVSYFVKALSTRMTMAKEELLIEIFDSWPTPLIRRLIILIMASWDCHYWLTDIKKKYGGLSEWEKRALILASYKLGDEGKHWRTHVKDTWNSREALIRDWYADRFQANKSVPV
ncbi:RNA-directed DNA polymerase [Accumulibacter sp.]|uniref:RNA-directed DNA polymerase n=1 Tax=Accumulibacter sp. TaxID=2053492 RepID=UPI0028C48C19|nr:RNA-directed DNA polymerase [Accumulibacter sp.]